MKKTIYSTNLELSKVGTLVLLNEKKNNSSVQVFNLLVSGSTSTNEDENKAMIENFASICDFVHSLATCNQRVKNYFEVFKQYGIFMPNTIKEQYFTVLRNASNNAIFKCIEATIIENYSGSLEDLVGKTVVKCEFESVYECEVPLKETALACNKKTLEAWSKIKHLKGWRNAARGLVAQFNAVSIKNAIKNNEDVKPELEPENESSKDMNGTPTNQNKEPMKNVG